MASLSPRCVRPSRFLRTPPAAARRTRFFPGFQFPRTTSSTIKQKEKKNKTPIPDPTHQHGKSRLAGASPDFACTGGRASDGSRNRSQPRLHLAQVCGNRWRGPPWSCSSLDARPERWKEVQPSGSQNPKPERRTRSWQMWAGA